MYCGGICIAAAVITDSAGYVAASVGTTCHNIGLKAKGRRQFDNCRIHLYGERPLLAVDPIGIRYNRKLVFAGTAAFYFVVHSVASFSCGISHKRRREQVQRSRILFASVKKRQHAMGGIRFQNQMIRFEYKIKCIGFEPCFDDDIFLQL